MANYIGEIRIFSGKYPRGWTLCNGQLLQIAQYKNLFSVLSTTYGGDGKTTFGVPNLQASAPLMAGAGIGLSPRTLGQTGGAVEVTLTTDQLPGHTHTVMGSNQIGEYPSPKEHIWAVAFMRGRLLYALDPGTSPTMSPQAFSPEGQGMPHNNMPPYLALNFCIALEGLTPSGVTQ